MIIDEKNFILGLDRVASIIIGNPNYGDLLGKRIIDIDFLDEKDKCKSIELAIEYFTSKLRKRGIRLYIGVKSSDCLCFVKTKNNIKEFELFKSIVKLEKANVSYINLAETQVVNAKIEKESISLLVKQISDILRRYYNSSILNASVIYQHYQYLCAYVDFMYTLSHNQNFKIHFTANDHSPIPVALTMNCIKNDIFTVYFQHASISKHFPDLIFDISVLYNKKSLDLYKANSLDFTKKSFILSRNIIKSPQVIISRLKEIQSKMSNDVVIYLTAIFNQKELLKLVSFLKEEDYIRDIYIKFHPSINLDYEEFILKKLEIKLCKAIPNFDHIAIVGNSSVLLELVSKGIPSFNCFKLDSIEKDYYGFVNSGVSNEINVGDSVRKSVEYLSYDDSFVKAVIEYNPSFVERYEKIYYYDSKKISLYINMLLTNDYEKYKYLFLENQIEKILFCYIEELRLISNTELIKSGFSIETVILFLESKFKSRDQKLVNVFNEVLLGKTNNLLYVWLQMYKIEWTGFKPSLQHIEGLFSSIFNLEKHISKKVYKILENKLLNILIRYKYIEKIESFFTRSNYINIGNLHINRRISLLRLIDKEFSSIDINLLYDGLSSYHALKMEVQGVHKDKRLEINHRNLECKIINLSSDSLSREFNEYVIPVYDFFREKMRFMDVSHNEYEVNNFKELIINKVHSSTPFCFIRLSDGEGYIFSIAQQFMTLDDVKNRERHWWGRELDSDLRKEIINNLINSLYNADVLGIPTAYRFIRDSVDKTQSFLSYLQGRGMYNVLQGLYNDPSISNIKFIGSDKTNLTLLSSKNDFVELMQVAHHTVFITSVKKDVLASKFEDYFDISYIELPTHFKTSGNDLYNIDSEPLPFVYKDIIEEIDKVVKKGSLVFVAGGIVGKIFISKCKEKGGVVIDVGSAIDMLVDAGIHSLH